MFQVQLGVEYAAMEGGTSEGTQTKYFKEGYWYKSEMVGNEGEIEYMVSSILKYSSLKNKEYVVYEQGMINGRRGCRSKNFLRQDCTFITFHRIHKNLTGLGMNEKVNQCKTLEEKIQYVIYFMKKVCKLDVTDYLRKVFTLDYLILNEDRHFNNLGVILNEKGTYEAAPIFDNGKSLLNGNFSVKTNLSLKENMRRVICQPFGGTHEMLYQCMGKGFEIDTKSAIQFLSVQEESMSRDVLLHRIKEL